VSLTESPVKAGVVWAGTDDGKVWVSPTGGGAWTDVTRNIRGIPAGLYVSRIEASHRDAQTAYVCFDGHRSDVFSPWLFVTHDLGQSWTNLSSGLPKDHTVKVVREDPQNPNLLFAGTEFGLFVSLDAGKTWLPWKHGLPTVAVDDIAVHPRERDLLVATHGRGLYVLDGIHILEQWNAASLTDSVQFAPPRAAWAYYERALGGKWGQGEWLGKNPPFGAWFDYFLPRKIEGGVSIAVADSAGREVRKLTGSGEEGFHRVAWDLVAGDPRDRVRLDESAGQDEFVSPGSYKVTLTAGKARPIGRTVEVRAVPGTHKTGL